ncbi:MAG: CRISPR system precrRNA processing endoribonuclease RAMP protein Cas6 [Firmicutes bacterium]|nr:CRISPR system precrRNA processing endoribonuclease RAMP protein Cas6 [Bacillota bacterium]
MFRLNLRVTQPMRLPPYKGSVLRGGFGSAFRRVACAQRAKDCSGCLVRPVCPYAYVFETSPPPDSAVLRNLKDVPRPFVIEPPEDDRTEYAPGDELDFGLVLIGRGVEYLPFFIAAFKELGRTGIGPLRAGFELVRVEQVGPGGGPRAVVYEGASGVVAATASSLFRHCVGRVEVAAAASALGGDSVEVEFRTPTRLKADSELRARPEFEALVRAGLRRVSSLAYFHHGISLDLDYAALVRAAREVRLRQDRTRWVGWKRYSNRQERLMDLGGLVGTATFEGDIYAFRDLLVLSSLVHIGKNTTFGLGRVCVC